MSKGNSSKYYTYYYAIYCNKILLINLINCLHLCFFSIKLSGHNFMIVKAIKMHTTAECMMLCDESCELLQPHPGTSQVQRKDFASSRAFCQKTQLIIAVKNSLHSSCTTSFFGPPGRGIETRFRCAMRAAHWGIPDPPEVSLLRRRQTEFCCFGLLNVQF